jgi:acyl carrier protein
MTEIQIRERVRAFIVENFLFGRETTFQDEHSLLEHSIVDSTGILELVSFIESELQVPVGHEELLPANLDSVDNIVRFVVDRQATDAP